MSATIELSALAPGSGSGKYEVNSNSDLSAAGDCSAGTPGKYRQLRPQPPLCTAAGDSTTCNQETLKNTDTNANEECRPVLDQKTDDLSNTHASVSDEFIAQTNQVQGIKKQDSEEKVGLLKNDESSEGTHLNNEDIKGDSNLSHEVDDDVTFNMSSNGTRISSEFDSHGGAEKLEPAQSPVAPKASVVGETNEVEETSMNNNSSSPADEDQEAGTLKQKSKKKGGILQAVQIHLPKFGMKRGHIGLGNKGRESSTSSDQEGSLEKKSGKKKKKEKHNKKRLEEEDANLDGDEDGDVVMATNDNDGAHNQIEEHDEKLDFEPDKSHLHEEAELGKESEKMPGSGSDEGGDVAMVTVDVAEISSETMLSKGTQSSDVQEETETDVHLGPLPTSGPVEDEGERHDGDAVTIVTEENAVNEGTDVNEQRDTTESGPRDGEPSSIPNSSLASGDDFYTLPQSSFGSSTNPDSSKITEDQCEDSSTIKECDSSVLAEDDGSLTAATSCKEAEEISETGDSSIVAAKTDGPIPKPDLIPDDEEDGDAAYSAGIADAKDGEQNQETSFIPSSNQSSFDTDSPSLTDTPEHSPKKKSKRRVPILNVALPSFSRKHHRSSKSPEPSSDSDRSTSPSKKFSWKKKSPKKTVSSTAAAEAAVSGSNEEETPKDEDVQPQEVKTQEESGETSEMTTDEGKESMVDLPESGTDEVAMDAVHPETTEDDEDRSVSDEEEEAEAAASCEGQDAGSEEAAGVDEQLKEGLENEREVSVDIRADVLAMPPCMQKSGSDESEEIAVENQEEVEEEGKEQEKEAVEEDEEMKRRDGSIDAQDNDMDGMLPGVKLEGKIQMSASLEVHASPTHHVSSPADFIFTDDSMEIEVDSKEDGKIEDIPLENVSVELTAAEKILKECDQLVADDSIGDVQFTPEMVSEFTKTIHAFEEEEERQDDGTRGDEEGSEELQVNIGEGGGNTEGPNKGLDPGNPDSGFIVQGGESSDGDHLTEVMGSVSVDVGCQMTWGDGDGENEEDAEVETSGRDGKIDAAFDSHHQQDVLEDADKKSVSSSSTSSSSSSENKAEEVSPEDFEPSVELHIPSIASKDDKISADVEVPVEAPLVAGLSVEADQTEGNYVTLPKSQPVEVTAAILQLESSDPPSDVAAEVSSSSTPQIQPTVDEASCDVDPIGVEGSKVQVVMNEGPLEPNDESPLEPAPVVKPKSKTKGFFSGFNFRMPRFRGRRSGKMDVTSKNNGPDIGEGTISFKTDHDRESDAQISAGISGLSKSSSELNVNRRKSNGSADEFVLDTRTPSVPDISQREMALKRAKKKSFTLPNMHLRLPRLSSKKSPKSPTTNKISPLGTDEIKIEPSVVESSPVLDGKAEIKADVVDVGSNEAEAAIEGDLKVNAPSFDEEKTTPEVQLPAFSSGDVEAPSIQEKIADSLGKEDSIAIEVLGCVQGGNADFLSQSDGISAGVSSGKSQVDGLFVAVPAVVEDDSEPDEGIQIPSGEEVVPEVNGELETELNPDINVETPTLGVRVTVPTVSGVLSDINVEPEADIHTAEACVESEKPTDGEVDVGILDRPTFDNCRADLSVMPMVSVPSDPPSDVGVGLSGCAGVGAEGDGVIETPLDSPGDVEVGLAGSFDPDPQLVDDVKFDLPEGGEVTVEAGANKECSSDDNVVNKFDVKASGEDDIGKTVDADMSVGLALSAGSGDTSLENQVETAEPSKEPDDRVMDTGELNTGDMQVAAPDSKDSSAKHRFKLPSLHFSLPKFGGLHIPTKKSSTKKSKGAVSPSAEVCSPGCEIPGGTADVDEVGDESISIPTKPKEDVEEAVPEPVFESELQASRVEPVIDVRGDLAVRFDSLEGKDSNDIQDDVKAKLNFDADETQQELSFTMDSPEKTFSGLEHQENPSSADDLGIRLADISFGAQVSPSYPECVADKDDCECHASAPSQEDPASSVDLNWEDEICSSVQVTAPKFTLSDMKGGLSLGVTVSEDGSVHSDTEEKVKQEGSDIPDGNKVDESTEFSLPEMPDLTVNFGSVHSNTEEIKKKQEEFDFPDGNKTAESTKFSLPEVPDVTVNSGEQPHLDETPSPQPAAPELSLSVGAASSQRKQSTSSHSSGKSTSSQDAQTDSSRSVKKKGSIMASLGLPKFHLKLSPRSKSPDRQATEPRSPEEHPESTSPTVEEAATSHKKPGGKGSKKGRWKPGKSSSKKKNKKELGGKSDGSNREEIPDVAGDADASLNIGGSVGVDLNSQPSMELDPRPSTSSGPTTSTPIKPSLSLNNSAQTALSPNSTNSLNIEQAIAIHSSPATPVTPQPPSRRPFLVVVAIDFGTTFSGYAYSFTRDPDDVQIMRKWEGGDPGVTNMKTPTTLLLHPNGEFHSFGFTARDFYHDMDHQEALRWLYFDKFKLALHNDPDLNLETELTAANGQKLTAIKVFEHALCFFREHAMEELCDQSNDGRFDPGDIRWVLTVPAIWKQPAKQFMREAAYRAGIASPSLLEQLLIALEPEAASLCIRKLRMRELVPERLSQRRKWSADAPEKSNSQVSENITHGTRYMVVDCGGGTVDITVHEVEEDAGTLKELHKAAGGMYGSVSVDKEFEKLLVDIFGRDYIEEFKIKRPAGWVDLMIAFESRKRNVNPYKNNPLNVSLPFSFIDYYKKYTHELSTVEEAIWNYKSRDVTWSAQGMMRFSPEGMQQLFRPAIASIISLVEGLLNEPQLKGVSYLFLAGGFAQSPLLQNQMRKKFASRLRVIIPRDVGLAILKGAVMFGLDPTAVRVRRSRLTYGVGVLNKFDPEKHPKDKHVVKDSTEWCRDIFDTFVQADQSVAVGDKVTRSYTPAKPSQKAIIINIYCTEKEKVRFITDEGVHKCGTMHIDVSDSPSVNLSKRRELQLTMQYGDTEIKVSALDVPTGRCVKANIDFLSK